MGRRPAVAPAHGSREHARCECMPASRFAIAVLALLLPFELRAVDPLLARAYADGAGGATFGFAAVRRKPVAAVVPAAAMGATFPVASRWFVARRGSAARDAGALYAANTVGAAIGALLAGFVLLPSLGLRGATWVGVALNVARGGWRVA